MDSTVRTLALAVLAGILAPAAMAQGLVDPTRPPDAPLIGEAGPAGVRQAPQLQSVLVSSNGRRVAVIDGRTVRVGDRVGNASVASIAGTSVVLRRGKASETLRLYPKPDAADKADKAGKKADKGANGNYADQ